jgi:hypothetical protein
MADCGVGDPSLDAYVRGREETSQPVGEADLSEEKTFENTRRTRRTRRFRVISYR